MQLPAPPGNRKQTEHRARVLVIEDDPGAAARLVHIVEAQGHTVRWVQDWARAVQLASQDVDLVLIDAVMPEIDGFKLTRLIRQRSRDYVPIVFVTASHDVECRQRALLAGADDFIAKPVDAELVAIRVAAMLRIRRLTLALAEHAEALAKWALVDGLTGLANRRAFDDRLAAEVARHARGGSFALLIADIDHFKRVNDTFGHDVGDEILAGTGRVLAHCLRAGDEAFRYGGEEFAILAPHSSAEGAIRLGCRVREHFESQMRDSAAGALTLSIGVAALEPGDTPSGARELFREADEALYESKRSGRNRVAVKAWGSDPCLVAA